MQTVHIRIRYRSHFKR